MRRFPLLSPEIGKAMTGFLREQNASVAITFAIALIPLAAFVGAAVDYSLANRAKSKLDALADAAALRSVSHVNLSSTTSAVQADALKFFEAQSSVVSGVSGIVPTVTVADSSTVRNADVSYSADVPTAFLGLLGFATIPISWKSTAASTTPTYIDFYLLLDNTPSMGVGATPTDVATMVKNTSDRCAFACHDVSQAPNDSYSLAKKLGVTMRIDVVRSATQQLMDTASETQAVPAQFRMAIYTFGSSAANIGLTAVQALTSSLSTAKTSARAIDLMTVPYQGYNNDQFTDFDNTLIAMNGAIATPGDGSASAQPQKILFLVSDGVADAYYPTTCTKPTTSGRCQAPLTVKNCTTLKSRGIKIAVLYTTYLALPTDNWYNTWIAPFNQGPYGPSVNSEIAKSMQSCASPGLYFEVSPTDGISEAMTALFQKAVQIARLTN